MIERVVGNKELEQAWKNRLRGSEKCLADLQAKWKDNPPMVRIKQIEEMMKLHNGIIRQYNRAMRADVPLLDLPKR